MAYGLYEVVPDKIYQVRGFDLANMTIIKGQTGWILFDVLTCKERLVPRWNWSINILASGLWLRSSIPTAMSTILAVSLAW